MNMLMTDLNPGAGNACASHNRLIAAPFATSKESDFADFGNFGDTRPAGSDLETEIVISLKMTHLYYRNAPPPFFITFCSKILY